MLIRESHLEDAQPRNLARLARWVGADLSLANGDPRMERRLLLWAMAPSFDEMMRQAARKKMNK